MENTTYPGTRATEILPGGAKTDTSHLASGTLVEFV